MNFPALVKARRIAAGLTLEDVAEACGMSKSQIWSIENDTTPNPGFYTVVRLSVALQVPITLLAAAILESQKGQ